MKRATVLMMALLLVTCALTPALAGPGPAPNAGDGVPDGSGFEIPPGPVGEGDPFGPAPNSGDGIPDGSGMTPPHAPSE